MQGGEKQPGTGSVLTPSSRLLKKDVPAGERKCRESLESKVPGLARCILGKGTARDAGLPPESPPFCPSAKFKKVN